MSSIYDREGFSSVSLSEIQKTDDSDDEGWEEREASRTHSVKFTDDLNSNEQDKEVSNFENYTYQSLPWGRIEDNSHLIFNVSDSFCTAKYTAPPRVEG